MPFLVRAKFFRFHPEKLGVHRYFLARLGSNTTFESIKNSKYLTHEKENQSIRHAPAAVLLFKLLRLFIVPNLHG